MAGGNILHFGAVRVRVTGSGNLDLQMLGYDDILTQTRAPLVMTPTSAQEKVRLFNFISPEMMFKFSTDEINEYFRVNRVTIFVKTQWSEYPA